MKKELILASLVALSSLSMAGKNVEETLVPVEDIFDAGSMFVYASGGYAQTDVKDDIQSGIIVLPDVLNDESNIWEAGIGYRYTEDVFATLFVQGSSLDEVSILNINASVNYKFSDLFVQPYIGAVLGYSMLEYDEIPVDTTGHQNVESKLDADGVTLGLQAGVDFPVTKNFTIFGKYQLMSFDHLMDIFKDSNIEHVSLQSVQGGIRYEFK
jgi:opacity protein-like surface antigen